MENEVFEDPEIVDGWPVFGPSDDEYNQLRKIFWTALQRVVVNDITLFSDGVSERAICARLARYIEDVSRDYPGLNLYRADVEYDRIAENPKVLGAGQGCRCLLNCGCKERELQNDGDGPIRKKIINGVPEGEDRWELRLHKKHDGLTADLVFHARGAFGREVVYDAARASECARLENKIAVEAKWSSRNRRMWEWDKCRVTRMTSPAETYPSATGYVIGFIVAFTTPDLVGLVLTYRNGVLQSQRTFKIEGIVRRPDLSRRR